MPKRESPPIGAPCWVNVMTSDSTRARDFYCQLFGWKAEEPNEELGGYFNFTKDGVFVAGGMSNQPGAGPGDSWSVYLATDDAIKTVEVATTNGAQTIVEAMPVNDSGTMAVIIDAGGAVIGIWQPGVHKGFGAFGETGTPSWFELHTREYDKTVPFYRDVFRWDTQAVSDTPEFRYTTQVQGDAQLAGIMDASSFLPEDVPAHWSVYFGVDDADATLAKVVELGGTIVKPAEDTPYGRLATATDPMGAQFKLVAPNEAMPASS